MLNELMDVAQKLYAGYAKYAPAIGLIATGVALVTAKNYGPGVQEILKGLMAISGGVAVVGMHRALHRIPGRVLDEARRN